MKIILRVLGLTGVLLFGLGFCLTFLSPVHYEKAATSFLQSQLEQRVREHIEIGNDGKLAALAKTLSEKYSKEIETLKETVMPFIQTKIATIISEMQIPNCECRLRMLQGLETAGKLRISGLEKAEPQLRRLIEGKYGEIVDDLLRDLRIFTGSNFLAFAFLLFLSFIRPAYIRHLFIPGLLLGIASVAASAMYIFGQNWFFAILYNDYVGMTYIVWLALIYGLLCDIALFKARITTRILDAVASNLGTAISVGPC